MPGAKDALAFAGRIESSSRTVKFERGLALAANASAAALDQEPTRFDGFLVDPTPLNEPAGEDAAGETGQGERVSCRW